MKNRIKFRMYFLLFMAIIFVISCDEILDIFPPDFELLSPTEEILTADTVAFLVDATDNKGIDRVAFTLRDPVDGKEVKKTINSAPFQLELSDVQTWSQIELEVKAYDEVGNFGLFEKILLIQSTVENASIAITDPNGNESGRSSSISIKKAFFLYKYSLFIKKGNPNQLGLTFSVGFKKVN